MSPTPNDLPRSQSISAQTQIRCAPGQPLFVVVVSGTYGMNNSKRYFDVYGPFTKVSAETYRDFLRTTADPAVNIRVRPVREPGEQL